MKAKSQFLFSSIFNTGIRKCIVYCSDAEEIQEIVVAIKQSKKSVQRSSNL